MVTIVPAQHRVSSRVVGLPDYPQGQFQTISATCFGQCTTDVALNCPRTEDQFLCDVTVAHAIQEHHADSGLRGCEGISKRLHSSANHSFTEFHQDLTLKWPGGSAGSQQVR